MTGKIITKTDNFEDNGNINLLGKKIPVGGIPGLDLSDPKQLADFARYDLSGVRYCVVPDPIFSQTVSVSDSFKKYNEPNLILSGSRWLKEDIYCPL